MNGHLDLVRIDHAEHGECQGTCQESPLGEMRKVMADTDTGKAALGVGGIKQSYVSLRNFTQGFDRLPL